MPINKLPNNLKIIDWETCGNVVRFYLGDMNNTDYWGDDWNDVPYEYNAGRVSCDDILYAVDIGIPLTCTVIETNAGYENTNSPFSKEDIKNGEIPCIGIIEQDVQECYYDYTIWDTPEVIKIFLGTSINEAMNQMVPTHANVLATYKMNHKEHAIERID